MKRIKVSLALLALIVATASAFTTNVLSAPPQGQGWYAADFQEVASGSSSYIYNTSNYSAVKLPGQPSLGDNQGQCSSDASFICAVNFDVNGDSQGSPSLVIGDFNQ